ncbi:hypothetical protein QDY28_17165 [Rhizobium sp. BR 362]
MTFVTTTVLATLNAPYGTSLSAEQFASKIVDPASAEHYDASAFAFFSEFSESLQHSFLDEIHVNLADALRSGFPRWPDANCHSPEPPSGTIAK